MEMYGGSNTDEDAAISKLYFHKVTITNLELLWVAISAEFLFMDYKDQSIVAVADMCKLMIFDISIDLHAGKALDRGKGGRHNRLKTFQ